MKVYLLLFVALLCGCGNPNVAPQPIQDGYTGEVLYYLEPHEIDTLPEQPDGGMQGWFEFSKSQTR